MPLSGAGHLRRFRAEGRFSGTADKVPGLVGVNVAVTVCTSLYCTVNNDTATVVVPVAGLTVCVRTGDVLPAKFPVGK